MPQFTYDGKPYDIVIPLGEACSTATICKEMNLRDCSLPFDWMANVMPHSLVQAFSEDLQDLLPTKEVVEQKFAEKKREYETLIYPILKKNKKLRSTVIDTRKITPPNYTVKDFYMTFKFRYDPQLNSLKNFCLFNKYGHIIMHDFNVPDFKNGVLSTAKYDEVKEKTDRRCKRLLDLIRENKRILFLHIANTAVMDTSRDHFADLCQLDELFQKKYGLQNYRILTANLGQKNQTVGNVTNTYIPWNIWRTSIKLVRNPFKAQILKSLQITK